MEIEVNKVYNMNCLDGMRLMAEQGLKADWCITDPPYGIGEDGAKNHSRSVLAQAKHFTAKNWDIKIGKEYFDLMKIVSKEQIIFGGNYYTEYLKSTPCWIVWDKQNGENAFADVEMAWCSLDKAARIVRYRWAGMLQGNMRNKERRIHPTQKPQPVIEWIINRFTKPGDLIVDPFMGSFTTAVACYKLGRKFIGFELDQEYFKAGYARLEAEMAQLNLNDFLREA